MTIIFTLFLFISISSELIVKLPQDQTQQNVTKKIQISGISNELNYNIIKFQLECLNLTQQQYLTCQYNSFDCIATMISYNEIDITQIIPDSYDFVIILGNFTNLIYNQQILNAFFYQDTNLLENQTTTFELYSQDVFLINIFLNDFFTYFETTLTVQLTSTTAGKMNSILLLKFSIINNGANNEIYGINQDSQFFSQSRLLSSQYLGNGQFNLYDLFLADYDKGEIFEFQVFNYFTNNFELDQLIIQVTPFYQNCLKPQLTAFNSTALTPSPSKLLNIELSNNIQSHATNLIIKLIPRLGYPINSQMQLTFLNLQSQKQILNLQVNPLVNIATSYQLIKYDTNILLMQFNDVYDQITFQFQIDNFINPIGLKALELQVIIYDEYNSEIENNLISIDLQSSIIQFAQLQFDSQELFTNSNYTLTFTLPNQQTSSTIIHIQVPAQINIQAKSISIYPQQLNTISYAVFDNSIEISSYFLLNQSIFDIEIQFIGEIVGSVQISDSFQIYTYNYIDSEIVILSQLEQSLTFEIISKFTSIISILPQNKTSSTNTNYLLSLEIPKIAEESILNIQLPEYYSQQLSNCRVSSILEDQIDCLIVNQLIIISPLVTGYIQITLFNLTTERLVMEYDYTLYGNITSKGLLYYFIQEQKFTISIQYPQTFYNYQITASNLYFGALSIYTFTFNITSIIESSDYLLLTFPQSLNNIDSCDKEFTILKDNQLYINNIQQGLNYLNCNVFNPIISSQIYPFFFKVKSYQDYLVVQYNDYEGIQEQLHLNSLKFNLTYSSELYQDLLNLSISFLTQIGLAQYGKIKLTMEKGYLYPNKLSCLIDEISSLEEIICEQIYSDSQTILEVTFLNSYQKGKHYLQFSNIKLSPPTIGTYTINTTLQNLSPTNQILEEYTQQSIIIAKCSNNCLTCIDNSNKCQSCNLGYYLFQNECYDQCPSNTFANTNYECIKCLTSSTCTNCNIHNITQCSVCNQGYSLYEGYCFPSQNNQSQIINHNYDNQSINKELDYFINIPIFIILSCLLLIISLIQDFIKNKSFNFSRMLKTYYFLFFLLDFMVSGYRIYRYSQLSNIICQQFSLICLTLQVINQKRIRQEIEKDKDIIKLYFKKFLLYQLTMVYSHRTIFQVIPQLINISVLEYLSKIQKLNIIIEILSIITSIIYFIKNEQFYMFILDDIIYNMISLLLIIFYSKLLKIQNGQQDMDKYKLVQQQQQQQQQEQQEQQQIDKNDVSLARITTDRIIKDAESNIEE